MTSSQRITSASVMTPPYKAQRKIQGRPLMSPKARLLNRANAQFFQTQQQSQKLKMVAHQQQSNATASSSSKDRVFRCLSNNKTHSQVTPPENRSLTAALKQSFQTPLSPTPPSCLRPQRAPEPMRQHRVQVVTLEQLAYYGARIDRTRMYQAKLRPSRPCPADSENSNSEEASTQESGSSTTASAGASSSPTTISNNSTKKTVTFQPSVTVVRIPSHRDYTERTKHSMWGSIKEIKANAVRNTAEFIHDRCNWRNCKEENQFYLDSRNGSLVHPVHVERYYAAWQLQQQKKKKQQQQREKQEQRIEQEKQQEHQEGDASNNNENQEQQPMQIDCQEEEVAAVAPVQQRRKRVRCCSPSPIRRPGNSSNISANHYTDTDCIRNADNDSDDDDVDHHQHQPKRLRIQAPVPCRPMYYAQATPPSHHYSYPGQHQCSYQQRSPMMISMHHHQHHPAGPFQHHYPVTMGCCASPPAAEII